MLNLNTIPKEKYENRKYKKVTEELIIKDSLFWLENG